VTDSDEPVRYRKPLRRTAWTLLIGGAVALVLMVGVGLLLLAGGEDIGPSRLGVLPAGEQGSAHQHPGLKKDTEAIFKPCVAQGQGPNGKPTYRWLSWSESVRLSTKSTIHCEQEAIFLTGTASAVVTAVQGPLFVVPIAAMVVGLLLFFPWFTLALARMGNGRFL
jgi:hypothetical protein